MLKKMAAKRRRSQSRDVEIDQEGTNVYLRAAEACVYGGQTSKEKERKLRRDIQKAWAFENVKISMMTHVCKSST